MDSVTDELMQVNKSQEPLNFKWEDNKINITFTFWTMINVQCYWTTIFFSGKSNMWICIVCM